MSMIRKTRSNAAWNGLAAEQRDMLERWLFEERLSYEQALERARAEFGFEGSIGSVARFYHRTAESRLMRDFETDEGGAEEAEALRAGMARVGKLFVQQVTENPAAIKEWAVLAKLLLARESNMLDVERNDIWRGGLALAREKFEFDAADAVLKQLDNREDLDAEELEREKARVRGIRERLYGRKLTEAEAAKGVPNG